MRALPLTRERRAWARGALLVGIDEVGRGPLAGPVVAAAVVLPAGCAALPGVHDSKTLNAARRAAAAVAVRAAALGVALGAASVPEIDRLNIRVATALAMRRALARLRARVDPALRLEVLVDGLPVPELGTPHEALVDGDAACPSVAAAGVVAKVVRDRLMARLAARYPDFGWATNAGYGTAPHLAALAARGPCAHHRRSFSPVAQLPLLG